MKNSLSKYVLAAASQIVERKGMESLALFNTMFNSSLKTGQRPFLSSISPETNRKSLSNACGICTRLPTFSNHLWGRTLRQRSFGLIGQQPKDGFPSTSLRHPAVGGFDEIWSRDYSSSSPALYQHRAEHEEEQTKTIPGDSILSEPPAKTPGAKQQRELKAVNTAVAVNVAILLAKIATWTLTNSGALLAEAMHSLADVVNQLLLRAGVQQSRRAPTKQHPYGFHREKYIYALMSAVGVFCLGAGASVLHGIQSLLDPPQLEHMGYNLAVLGISAAAEMVSLKVAFSTMRTGAKEQRQSLFRYIMHGHDPTTAAVLAEDAGAVAGLGIAGTASYLTWLTADPLYDAVGSIAVGVLMGGVAVMLIRNNKRFLIGQAMSQDRQRSLVDHLKADPMVLCVIDPMSEELGDGVYRFKAEIQWSGDRVVHKYLGSLRRDSLYSKIRSAACAVPGAKEETLEDALDLAMMEFGRGVIRTVGEEIDRLEEELKRICPGLEYVDLETDRGRTESAAAAAAVCIISNDDKDTALLSATVQ